MNDAAPKRLRRTAVWIGFFILAILALRMFVPGPDLEMTPDSCAGLDAQPEPLEKARRFAIMLIGRDGDRIEGDWALLCKFRRANAKVLAGPPVDTVMIGDSITEYWQKGNPELFGKGLVNRGIAGQTSAQILIRFQQDAVALHPRVVHIMAGLNDIAGNTGRISPQDYKNNITAMIDIAKANGIAVVLGSITPARDFFWRKGIDPSRRIVELNRWLADTARSRGLVYADYHKVLADARGYPRPELESDGSHPNGQAFDAMKLVLEAALAKAGAEAGAGLEPAGAGPI